MEDVISVGDEVFSFKTGEVRFGVVKALYLDSNSITVKFSDGIVEDLNSDEVLSADEVHLTASA